MPAFRNIKAESNWNASHTHDGKVAKAKAKAAARRNARLALLVNNWPGSSASGKKARKLQRNLRYTLQRSVEDSGEIEMPGKWRS
ncbi:hypothetical protein CDD82_1098 [Ophiocordyceps australis]|uniref:Uncharacterized protein n=1 Tax=Ophiocordyceps australis TaxID=1399860 RepID=A0A2C5YEA3_9HYPO|nr:hypothetical protein CDD82_1098 [Ophiocordyceps australis]